MKIAVRVVKCAVVFSRPGFLSEVISMNFQVLPESVQVFPDSVVGKKLVG